MIKVQPAHSRIVKTEDPDRLKVLHPRPGLLGVGGAGLFLSLLWLGGMIWGLLAIEDRILQIGAGFLLLPGLGFLLGALSTCLRSWSLERTADEVIFTRSGLLGARVRKWPAQDVSSFWVHTREDAQQSTLIIGFRNGRSEELLLLSRMKEDFEWIAAIMKEPRGKRKAVPATVRAAAEPVPRRSDPSADPPAVRVRKFDTGVALDFLPLLHFRGRWTKLLGTCLLGMVVIVGASELLVRGFGSGYPMGITRAAAAIWLLVTLGRLAILRQSTIIQVLDGLVTISQNQHRSNYRFSVGEVDFVQTYQNSGKTELQFLMKGKPKVRLLHDRPADELEWAARFLRVAIKGRAPEEAAVLKIQTAEGQCQVCGEKMESRVVFCGKCRTPHHEECWSYVGTCSTFGCREIRFTRA